MPYVVEKKDRKTGAVIFCARFKNKLGEEQQITTKARSERECYRIAYDLEREHEQIRLGQKPDPEEAARKARSIPRFRDIAEEHLNSLDESEYRTKRDLVCRLRKRVLPFIGDELINEISPKDIDDLLDIHNRGTSKQLKKHIKNAVSVVFNRFIRSEITKSHKDRIVYVNPTTLCKKLKPTKYIPKFLTMEQVPRLLEEIPEHWRNVVRVAIGTGARKWEILGLCKSDVHLEEREIDISRGWHNTPKSNEERTVPIPEWLVPFLEQQLKASTGVLLFPNFEGKRWSRTVRLHDIIKRALVKADLVTGYEIVCRTCDWSDELQEKSTPPCGSCGGDTKALGIPLPIRFKDLRSTWATHAVRVADSIRVAQIVLGHADQRTTERYVGRIKQHEKDVVNRIDYGIRVVSPTPGN